MNILEMLPSITASIGTTGLILWFTRSWLTERLRQSIKHEYDEKIEKLKAVNASILEKHKADF